MLSCSHQMLLEKGWGVWAERPAAPSIGGGARYRLQMPPTPSHALLLTLTGELFCYRSGQKERGVGHGWEEVKRTLE